MDNGSVYTKHLTDFLTQKTKYTVLPYNKLNNSDLNNYDSFILSGRRKNNREMNVINSKIIKHAINKKKPLLGICYGAEILTLTLGGTIKKSNPLRGTQEVIILEKNPLCEGKIDVFESHNYEISRIPEPLKKLATSNTCSNEIIWLTNSNIFGTQFHPEMTNDGKNIIEKFCML